MRSNKLKIGIIGILSAATAATALCACGNKSAKTYTVTFDTRGGSSVSSRKLEAGDKISRPSTVPTKDMFVFDDWYTDTTYTQKFNFNTRMPSHNVTIYAGWIGEASVEVSFNANGGEFDGGAEEYVVYGDVGATFAMPSETPERDGYAFGGWYTDEACTKAYSFTVYPLDNITLYAGWNDDAAYAYVSYYGNGELVARVPVKKNDKIEAPDLFDADTSNIGWFTNEAMTEEYPFGANASNDISLYTSYYTNGLTITNGVVTGYNGNSARVVVPEKYDGKTVTEIGEYAFYRAGSYTAITSVALPKSVTKLADGAFYDCQYLVSAGLTDGVKEIGANAFYKNMRLKNIGDISSVESIGEAAFIGCKVLSSIELPDTLTTIGEYAFTDCEMLTEIVIPTRVRQISDYMFSGCSSLKKVDITTPRLNTVNARSFENCTALEQVIIRSVVPASLVGITASSSPFAYNANVSILVPSSTLETYVRTYGQLDNGTLGEKFKAIG